MEVINTGNVDKCLPKSIAFINFICALLQKTSRNRKSNILAASLCSVDLYCAKLLQISQINIPSVSCKPIEVTSLSSEHMRVTGKYLNPLM